MANQSKLKAWVRYDGTNTVVTAGPIFRAAKPKVGNWRQINSGLCCNFSSTTTTTTGGGGITPTAWVTKAANREADSALRACTNPNATILLYTSVNTVPLPPNTPLYTDAALTTLITTTYPDYAYVSINDWVYEVAYNGYTSLNPAVTCSSISTTTTTSAVPFVYTLQGSWSFMDRAEACSGANSATYYSLTPQTMIGNGSQIFTNPSLTAYPTQPYVALSGNSYQTSMGFLANSTPC